VQPGSGQPRTKRSGSPTKASGAKPVTPAAPVEPVDIRAVARASGFSLATVSRALNGQPEVSATTRARIVETARQLGYRPNLQARTLVRGRSDTVGLIWDSSYITTHGRQPFLQDLLVGLKLALAETHYHLMLLSPEASDRSPDTFIRAIEQHSLDGVALMAVNPHDPAFDALVRSGRPCVGLDLPVAGPRATYVSSGNRAGAAAAVQHLYDLGHRRIATITGPPLVMPSDERLDAFRDTARRLGLRTPAQYVQTGDFFLPSGHACMRRLLRLRRPPTAVFVAGDEMAVGAIHAINDAGLDVPGDISIVGYDDIEVASLVRPSLTTIAQDYLAIGRAAIDILRGLMNGPLFAKAAAGDADAAAEAAAVLAPRLIPGRLTVRASSGPAPSDT
jgi:LacI family transcriptional regulator